MPKHPIDLAIPFQAKGKQKIRFCPECGRSLRAIVPAREVTYLVHYAGNPCVIDNVQGGDNVIRKS